MRCVAKAVDLTHRRFGMLEVIARVERPKYYESKYVWWLCRCDCGGELAVPSKYLVDKTTKSCGCLRSRLAKERLAKFRGEGRE